MGGTNYHGTESVSNVIDVVKDSVPSLTRATVMVSTIPYRYEVLSINNLIYDIKKWKL